MRVTGGRLKGRRVSSQGLGGVSKHGVLRATSSKVRESIFNILAGRTKGAAFVDLYAGTGAVGMEAMSRGAETVFFVEADRKRAEGIERLLEGCGCQSRSRLVKMKAAEFIERTGREGGRWDIVFLDPPYGSEEIEVVLPMLGEGRVLGDDAIVIVEHGKNQVLPDETGLLKKEKSYRYGDTVLTLYTLGSQ